MKRPSERFRSLQSKRPNNEYTKEKEDTRENTEREKRNRVVTDLMGTVAGVPSYNDRTEPVRPSILSSQAARMVGVIGAAMLVVFLSIGGAVYFVQVQTAQTRAVESKRVLGLLSGEIADNVDRLSDQIDILSDVEYVLENRSLETAPQLQPAFSAPKWSAFETRIDLFDEAFYAELAGFYVGLTTLDGDYAAYEATRAQWRSAAENATPSRPVGATVFLEYAGGVNQLKLALAERKAAGESLLAAIPAKMASDR